eukprot:CAMPEP_0178423176 /NCGR_PEP_ID=MMETSP0689_2-20121128/27554_1 /TAXON_ID=160604 /ORGANISM="Amphidinium massartii, Strain CS-259" /LENGTH=238 /DNA_ID=CAMNT_0020044763 /DNA_START=96 /DNA_END=812 /DNA_ORIENTATION=-
MRQSGSVRRLSGFTLAAAAAYGLLSLSGFSSSLDFISGRPAPAGSEDQSIQRRNIVGGLAGAALLPASPAFAFETYTDLNKGFEFIYPTGLQKSADSSTKFYDVFLRDILQPLEGVSVKVTETSRNNLKEIGELKEIGIKLMDDSVPPQAPREFLGATMRKDRQGREYAVFEWHYQWKFPEELARQLERKKYQLREKAILVIDRKRQFVGKMSIEEERWSERAKPDDLGVFVDSFKLL